MALNELLDVLQALQSPSTSGCGIRAAVVECSNFNVTVWGIDSGSEIMPKTPSLFLFVNTFKSNVGVALLAMPYAFNRGGWLGSSVAFTTAAVLTRYSMHCLIAVMHSLHHSSDECDVQSYEAHSESTPSQQPISESQSQYLLQAESPESIPHPQQRQPYRHESITARTRHAPNKQPRSLRKVTSVATNNNSFARGFVDLVLFTAMVGACIAYVSFLCAGMNRLVPSCAPWMWSIACGALFSPVAFAKSVSGVIVKIAAVGIVSLLFGCGVFVFSELSDCPTPRPLPAVRGTLPETVGIAAFANEGLVALASNIYADIPTDKLRKQYPGIVSVTIAVCLLLMGGVGLTGAYCTEEVPNMFTDALPLHKHSLNTLTLALLLLQIACTFPQVCFVVLQMVSERVLRNPMPPCSRVLPVAIVFAICGVGGVVSNVSALIALIGGLANASVTFVTPILLYHFMFWESGTARQCIDAIVVFLATACGIVATVYAALDMANA